MMMLPRPWKCALIGLAALVATAAQAAEAVVWKLDDVKKAGGLATEVVGAPRVMEGAAVFDGKADGIFVPEIPIAGATAFTIEVLFNPAEGGPEAQRFVHVEDGNSRRGLIEIRLDGKGAWWLDTHIRPIGGNDRGLTLIEPKLTHATGRWYWVALRYDGNAMTSFVNGVQELEGAAKFEPFASGKISIGVRQNKVYWFKGAIREVRFSREALPAEKLQRVR
jgi:hypothetical protein